MNYAHPMTKSLTLDVKDLLIRTRHLPMTESLQAWFGISRKIESTLVDADCLRESDNEFQSLD